MSSEISLSVDPTSINNFSRGFLFAGGAGAVPSGGGHKSFLGFPSLSESAGCLAVILKLDFAQFDRSIAHSALFFPFEKDSCKRL
jgi:hypothetical protein